MDAQPDDPATQKPSTQREALLAGWKNRVPPERWLVSARELLDASPEAQAKSQLLSKLLIYTVLHPDGWI